MLWRAARWSRTGAALVVIASVAGCSGGDSDPPLATDVADGPVDSLVGDNFVPVTNGEASDDDQGDNDAVVVSCGADGVAIADDWPFGVANDIVVADTFAADDRYVLAGATLDAEQVLIDTMDTAFPGFVVGDPDGGPNDMTVDFASDTGDARLVLADPDQDGCWSVEIRAAFGPDAEVGEDDLPIVVASEVPSVDPSDDPDADSGGAGTGDVGIDEPESNDEPDEGDGAGDPFVDDEPDDIDTSVPTTTVEADETPADTIDPFDQVVAVGSGDVVSGRGSFPIAVSRCVLAPLSVEAVASTATLTIEVGPDNAVKTVWTYDDGVVIEDADSRLLRLDGLGASLVADGVNDEGPETLLIDFICD